MNKTAKMLMISLLGAASLGALAGCDVYPPYHVWSARMQGRAELAQAQGNRQIKVQEAMANAEAATYQANAAVTQAGYEAKAEVLRAQGVAQANKIIGDSLKGNEEYLHYLYVNNLAKSKDQIIYVPTETGMPILEAGHRPGPK